MEQRQAICCNMLIIYIYWYNGRSARNQKSLLPLFCKTVRIVILYIHVYLQLFVITDHISWSVPALRGFSRGPWYCLYWRYKCKQSPNPTGWGIQAQNPGCCVMQDMVSSSNASIVAATFKSSWQHTHSSSVGILWHCEHIHLHGSKELEIMYMYVCSEWLNTDIGFPTCISK